MDHIFGYYTQKPNHILNEFFNEKFFKLFNISSLGFWQRNIFNRDIMFKKVLSDNNFDIPEIINNAVIGLGFISENINQENELQPFPYQGIYTVSIGKYEANKEVKDKNILISDAFATNTTHELSGTFANATYFKNILYLNRRVVPIYVYSISDGTWVFCSKDLDNFLNFNNISYKKIAFPPFSSIAFKNDSEITFWRNICHTNNKVVTFSKKLIPFLYKNFNKVYFITSPNDSEDIGGSLDPEKFIIEKNEIADKSIFEKLNYLAMYCDKEEIESIFLSLPEEEEDYIEYYNSMQTILDLKTNIKPTLNISFK